MAKCLFVLIFLFILFFCMSNHIFVFLSDHNTDLAGHMPIRNKRILGFPKLLGGQSCTRTRNLHFLHIQVILPYFLLKLRIAAIPFSDNREVKKLRRLLQGKRHFKIELCVRLSVSRLFDVGHVVQIDGVHLRLLGTNGLHVKVKNKIFTAAGSACRQNLKCENFISLFGRPRQQIKCPQKACYKGCTISFPYSVQLNR